MANSTKAAKSKTAKKRVKVKDLPEKRADRVKGGATPCNITIRKF